MFRTNQPVTDVAFQDREEELGRLLAVISDLAAGSPSWLAILGSRKIGKTSLILEGARRAQNARVKIASIDTLEDTPVSTEFFRRYALRVLDTVFASEIGESPEALASEPNEYRAALVSAPGFGRLDAPTRRFAFDLPEAKLDHAFFRRCLELPERLAQALDTPVLVAIDEFQELAALAAKKGGVEPYPMMRSAWQRQRRTAYVISGSARSMLERLVTSRSSPFFQHFALMNLGPLPSEAAVRLLVEGGPASRPISEELAREVAQIVGCHPFYLQVVGEALVRADPPYDRAALRIVLQELLFSRTGRLALYFENELERLVGRSRNLAAVLEKLAEGPMRLADLARALGAPSGQTSGYVERLGDAVHKRDDGLYALADETFGLFLRWRRPGGSVLPMVMLGDEGEREVAEHLARCGFELVYQSRASRGAFDLLATRGSRQLGIQVKRSHLPLRFTKQEWVRMSADAKRLGWRWVVAAVSSEHEVLLLDPAAATMGRAVWLHPEAAIANIVSWVDSRPDRGRAERLPPARRGGRAVRRRTGPGP